MLNYTQNELKSMALDCAEKIKNAIPDVDFFEKPFKHVVIDNFFDVNLAMQCLESFPDNNAPEWDKSNDADIEIKQRSRWESEFDIPDGVLAIVRVLNSSILLKAMSDILGIPKLVPDPYFSGGGLNMTLQSGLLDVHVDGNYHDATGLNRRVNAILYLNPNWKDEWGGEFGLYDGKGEQCVKKVPPLFNRLVIFDTHDFSFHGLPDPINFPENEPRRSVILYYYTKEDRPMSQVSEVKPHSALWKKRGFLDKRGSKTRKYQ